MAVKDFPVLSRKVWANVCKIVGGVHMLGHLWVVIHDGGVTVAWKQIVRADWRA